MLKCCFLIVGGKICLLSSSESTERILTKCRELSLQFFLKILLYDFLNCTNHKLTLNVQHFFY